MPWCLQRGIACRLGCGVFRSLGNGALERLDQLGDSEKIGLSSEASAASPAPCAIRDCDDSLQIRPAPRACERCDGRPLPRRSAAPVLSLNQPFSSTATPRTRQKRKAVRFGLVFAHRLMLVRC